MARLPIGTSVLPTSGVQPSSDRVQLLIGADADMVRRTIVHIYRDLDKERAPAGDV